MLHSNTLKGGLGGGAAQEVPLADFYRIVRAPTGCILCLTFEPKDVKGRHALLPALITTDTDPLIPVFLGHRGQGNVHVCVFNEEALVHHQFLTEGAASLSRFEKRREAVVMESVTTRQELDGVSTGVEGFETNGAVVAGGI